MNRAHRYTVNRVSSWRRSSLVAVIAITIFLLVQIAVPVSRLGVHDNALRFGWQMFSTARETPSFVVITDTGSETIDINEYMAGARGDVDIVGNMPAHLCTVVAGAVRVTWGTGELQC